MAADPSNYFGKVVSYEKSVETSYKKTFNVNEKNQDLGLLKILRKQEGLLPN